MSDAMTNREIEDVLTSIRRLVAQDGTRATERPAEPALSEVPRGSGRLILTEAQRIDAQSPEAPAAEPVSELAALPGPDFGRLEATIAELEAAVSASGGAWEGEAVEEPPRASNVTDLYGRLPFASRREAEGTANPAPANPAPASAAPTADPVLAELSQIAAQPADPSDLPIAAPDAAAERAPADSADTAEAVFELPSPEGEPGEAILDEAALYALVAQIVREELHGQLGERITAQVRKLVRAEIAKALDDRKFL